MSGKTLKELLKDLGCNNVSELARAMGIGVVNLHKAFEVQDVKTGLLEDIARALKISVCDFYPSHPVTHYEINDAPIVVGWVLHPTGKRCVSSLTSRHWSIGQRKRTGIQLGKRPCYICVNTKKGT